MNVGDGRAQIYSKGMVNHGEEEKQMKINMV